MRYVLIDRIERLEIGKHIVAIKNVTLSEDVFTEHFVGYPVMPGALLIESLAQAGTALLEVSDGMAGKEHATVPANITKKALLIMVLRAKFKALVRPGDQLRIGVTLLSRDNDTAETDGTIRSGERLVAEAKLVFAVQDVAKFYPEHIKQLVETGYDVLLRDAEIIHPKAESSG